MIVFPGDGVGPGRASPHRETAPLTGPGGRGEAGEGSVRDGAVRTAGGGTGTLHQGGAIDQSIN